MNILIVNKNANYCVKLLNNICKKNSNIRIANIANTIEDMYKFTSTMNFDIILLDVNLLSEDLDKYEESFLEKYKTSIILLYDKNNIHRRKSNFHYVFKHDFDSILNKIFNISASSTENILIKRKIQKELEYLGYKPKHFGTTYIAEIIYIVYSTNFDGSLEGKIYPYVAQIHNKSVNTIKCNIVNATSLMFCECSEDKFISYFGQYTSVRPGPKTVIYTIINKISA